MSRKDISRSVTGCGPAASVAVQIDRVLASLGDAEISLRNLRSSRLPEMAEALALAAFDLQSLRLSLSNLEPDRPIGGALRARMQQLGYASSRVCVLYGAARKFHEGLALIRRTEAGAYDAHGEVRGMPVCSWLSHRLETQG